MKLICVYGSVNYKIDDSYKKIGFELGKRIAEKNYGLVYSGMNEGISGAVAKGVSCTGNFPIIGVMPEFFKEKKKDEIFDGCTEKIFAINISERKEIIKKKSDAIIVAPGGVGTFDELFDAICTKRWGLIDIPIVIYNMNNYYNKMIEMLDYAIENNFGKENYRETYKVFDNINEMFNYIDNYSVEKKDGENR